MNWSFILVGIIGLIYPIYILFTYQRINALILKDQKFRLIDYKRTILLFWTLAILVIIYHFARKSPNFSFLPNMTSWDYILTGLVLVFSYFQYHSAKITMENYKIVKEKLSEIYHYLPKSKMELRWFVLLSISAGICEEIIFRLFFFEFLVEHCLLIVAFLIPNMIFALTHLGSGMSNLVSSFILGLLFSGLYFFTGNIWIPILLHCAIDINMGILGYNVHLHENPRL